MDDESGESMEQMDEVPLLFHNITPTEHNCSWRNANVSSRFIQRIIAD